MLPELFSIGPLTFYSYGLLIGLGVIAAISLGERRAKQTGLAEEGFITSLGVISVIGGFLGAKILFYITILPEIIEDISRLKELSDGFVVYGGLIGGILTAFVYCKVKKVDFWAVFDLAAPLIALAQCSGRLGCFMTGCCYGQETDSALGVVFHNSFYAPHDVKLFPIQLVSSALNLVNFVFLSWLWKKNKDGDQKKGMVGVAYIITYSVGRFVIEFFRGDLERGAVGALSTSQFISIFTVIIGIVMFVFLRRKKEVSE